VIGLLVARRLSLRTASETEEELFSGTYKMLSFPFLCNSGHYSAGTGEPIKRHDSVVDSG